MQDGDDDIDTRATMAAGAIPETDETDGAGSASPREAEDYDMNTSPVSSPAPVVIATTSAGDHDSDSDSDGDGDDVVAQPLAHVQKQPAPAKSTQIATYGKQSSSLTTTEVHLAFRVAVEALMKKALLAGKNPQRSALVSPPLPTPTNPAVPDNSEQVKVTVVLVCASWSPNSFQPAHCQQYCTVLTPQSARAHRCLPLCGNAGAGLSQRAVPQGAPERPGPGCVAPVLPRGHRWPRQVGAGLPRTAR